MAELSTARPDIDIDADIGEIIIRYPPLVSDQHHIQVHVENGVVYLKGHTTTPINRRYLVDRASAVRGVTGVNDSALYDDVNISLQAGQLIPAGVLANTYYGTVVLSGKQPHDPDTVAMRVAQIPGVVRVVTMFNNDAP